MPLVSIIIPTYNRAQLIQQTINSIQKQALTDWECIVVDDNSTDNTSIILDRICQEDNRIKYYKNENSKGAPGARNTGLKYSNSPWVLFFDSDNTMSPYMVEKLYKYSSETEADVITCWSNIIDRNLNTIIGNFNWFCEGDILEDLITAKTYVDTNSALIKKEKIEVCGGWSEDCPSFQEWDLHLRLCQTSKYTTIKETLTNYYINGEDTISKDRNREIEGYLYILKKYNNLWKRYPDYYLKYGERVLSIINDTKYYKHLNQLFSLFPSLRKQFLLMQLKKLYHKIKCSNK